MELAASEPEPEAWEAGKGQGQEGKEMEKEKETEGREHAATTQGSAGATAGGGWEGGPQHSMHRRRLKYQGAIAAGLQQFFFNYSSLKHITTWKFDH